MPNQTQFDLNRVIAEVVGDSPSSSPAKLAQQVLAQIPEDRYRDVLQVLLPQAITRWVLVNQPRPVAASLAPSPTRDTPVKRPIPEAKPDRPEAHSGRSAKVAGIRDWRARLDEQVYVGAQWRRFGGLTAVDFSHLASTRFNQASRLAELGKEAQQFSQLLTKHNVVDFDHLPEPVQKAALERS